MGVRFGAGDLLVFDLSLHETEELPTILQKKANDVRRDLLHFLCTAGFSWLPISVHASTMPISRRHCNLTDTW